MARRRTRPRSPPHKVLIPALVPPPLGEARWGWDASFRPAYTFRATTKENGVSSPPQMTRNGIAWTRLNSGMKDGTVEISVSLGQTSERRVVQQVAAEPCHLHVSAEQKGNQVVLQTEPVRDCRGNAVPDGTIVTFTKTDKLGRSTVDAPVKKGVARTEMAFGGSATISVACGVVVGNDIRMGGTR